MPTIRVDSQKWLEYLLNTHAPVVIDIGDQRDPYDVVVCKCGKPGRAEAKAIPYDHKGPPLYSQHLVEIIQSQYFANLDTDYR